MDLVVRRVTVGHHRVLLVSGEVDLATLPRLADNLTRNVGDDTDLVVDLDGVTVMDDAGLGLLLGAAGRARMAGRDLTVVCSAAGLRARLTVTGFDRAITVVDRISDIA